EEMLDLANEHGFPLFSALALCYRGWWSLAVGRVSEGVSLQKEGISLYRATGATVGSPRRLAQLAYGYAELGQPAEALVRLREAAQLIEATDERYYEAEVYRLQGDLLNAAGEQALALENYHRALAVARRQSAKLFELRAAMRMARLWRDQGKRDEARDLLAPVYGWFAEGFDTRDLKEAKALLDELAS
ncbi:MAG: hypothetical protein WCE28_25895, partial [Bradyrhizobium sp.]